ncbi:MAG: HD domain-containing protein [Candidatus Woesearchaeota archaeon]
MIDPKFGKIIEEEIIFLVDEYRKSGKNSKPVILHSLNLTFYLLGLGYDHKIIQAAVLHDLLEDSDVKIEQIEERFGKDVAKIVNSLTFNPNIEDKEEQYKELFARTKKGGKKALIVKCGDIYINSFYINLINDKSKEKFLVGKMKYFLDISKDVISEEKVWLDLQKRMTEEEARIKEKFLS